jgi:hypothetical protein
MEVVAWFKQHGVLVSSIKKKFIRLVTHLGVSEKEIQQSCELIKQFKSE